MELTSHHGQLWMGSQAVHIKGTSWFGFETPDACVHGLWVHDIDFYLDWLVKNNINAIRLPFSLQLALNPNTMPKTINASINPDLDHCTSLQVMERVIEKAGARGILVLLDNHRLEADKDIPPLWYNDKYPESAVIQGLQYMTQRFGNKYWNIVGIDIKNEPHGAAQWGTGGHSVDWKQAAARLGNAVLAVCPRMLIFVEGVERGGNGDHTWWGGHIAGAVNSPVQLSVRDKLVYSPHNYPAVILGEWGGRAEPGSKDRVWMQAFAQFLIQLKIDVGFFWCLNPNSGDTGGLLQDDWTTPEVWKLELLHQITPAPTVFVSPGSGVGVQVGSGAQDGNEDDDRVYVV